MLTPYGLIQLSAEGANMAMNEVLSGVALTLTAAFASAAAGLFATWITGRLRLYRKQNALNIETIAARARSGHIDEAALGELINKAHLEASGNQQAFLNDLKAILATLQASDGERVVIENLVSGYHEQALTQSSVQFWFSVAAATAGFAMILYSARDVSADNLATILKILPGAVVDAVAVLFFKQAAETRQRATELYDRLRRDKQISESIALIASIEDERTRSIIKAQVALQMAGLEPAPINLVEIIRLPEVQ